MKNRTQPQLLVIATIFASISATEAAVTLIQENFDNYGTSAVQLSGQSGGSGFAGNWTNVGGAANGYAPTNLVRTTTGYVNTGETGSNDGAASNNGYAAGLNGFNSTRAITRPTAYLGVTGNTVWFSFTLQVNATDSGNNVYFNLMNTPNLFATGNFVVGAGTNGTNPTAFQSYQDFTSTYGAAVTSGSTNLIVGSITVDAAAADTLSVWYNPSDVSSIAAMGAANYTDGTREYSTLTAFMSGLSVGIRSDTGTPNDNYLDSIRVAYDDTAGLDAAQRSASGFNAVTIPEPSSVLLVGLGGLTLAFSRRRNNRA